MLAGPDLKAKRPSALEARARTVSAGDQRSGIFVAGDVRFNSVKRCASAVGEGSIAIQFVHQYLATL